MGFDFTSVASSSFAGGNEDPLSEGGVWTASNGVTTFTLSANTATPQTVGSDCGSDYIGVASPNDQYSRANLTVNGTTGGGSGIGLHLRYAAGARTLYRFVIDHAAADNASINRIVGGVSTLLSNWTQPFTDGDQFTFAIEGQKLHLFDKNLALIVARDDSGGGGPTTGRFGVEYSSSETSASLDNWEGGSFVQTNPTSPSVDPSMVI